MTRATGHDGGRGLARAVATVGYVGFLRPAPGTWGSLAALPLGWIAMRGGPVVFTALAVLLVPLGLWAVRRMTAGKAVHDPEEIVIDEVLGQWIALLPVAWGSWAAGASVTALWPGWLVAFVAFRLFDVWKPGPVGWLDARTDAWGVMGDDMVAGAMAALVVVVAAGAAHL